MGHWQKLVSIYVVIPIHHSALHAKEGLEPSTTAPNANNLIAVTNQFRFSWNWTKDPLVISEVL